MEDKSREIGLAQINPYIRYVNRLENATHDKHIVPWRILYDFEIIFVTQGELLVLKEDSQYVINEGCLHIMPPFVTHTRIVPENVKTTYYGVHLDFVYDESSSDFSAWEIYKKPCERRMDKVGIRQELVNRNNYIPDIMEIVENHQVDNKQRFTELFSELYNTFHDGTINSKFKAKAYMILIIAELLESLNKEKGATRNNGDRISWFIDYTINHYSEEIDLNKVISEYGISPSRFRAIFKQQMNRSPMEYIIDYKIEQAKKLLSTNKYNVSEVSYMVGYDDMHYFSRLFKQKVGCSPKKYLESLKNL